LAPPRQTDSQKDALDATYDARMSYTSVHILQTWLHHCKMLKLHGCNFAKRTARSFGQLHEQATRMKLFRIAVLRTTIYRRVSRPRKGPGCQSTGCANIDPNHRTGRWRPRSRCGACRPMSNRRLANAIVGQALAVAFRVGQRVGSVLPRKMACRLQLGKQFSSVQGHQLAPEGQPMGRPFARAGAAAWRCVVVDS
jgi:hypothetical protein